MNLSLTTEAKEHLASDLDGRVLRIAFTKINSGMKLLCLFEHRLGEIDAKHNGSAFNSQRRYVTWPAGDVEQLGSLPDPRGIQ